MDPLLADTVSVLRRTETGRNSYGQPVYTWTQVAQGKAAVQPLASWETDLERETTVLRRWLLTEDPALFGLTAVDRVEAGGHTFEVQGEPRLYTFDGDIDHMEAQLRLVQG